jgi:DNA topoisomerase-1
MGGCSGLLGKIRGKMSRYKPLGWRNDSHRHYLAAKGIKTRYDHRFFVEKDTKGRILCEECGLPLNVKRPLVDKKCTCDRPWFAKKSSNAIEYKDAPKGAEYDKVGIDSKGRRVRLYSKEHKELVAKKKFSRVDRLKKKYPQILSRVEKDLSSKDQSTRENAMAMYVILKTGLRPGSYKETLGDVQAYGVSTLKAEHVTVKGNVVRFHFIGKKGVKIEKVVVDPKMASIIRKQKKSGKELFPTVNDSSLRSYVAKFGQYKTKDFRTLHANTIATKLMNKGVDRKAVVVQVAAELQNTPGVAKGAYIAPDTIAI